MGSANKVAGLTDELQDHIRRLNSGYGLGIPLKPCHSMKVSDTHGNRLALQALQDLLACSQPEVSSKMMQFHRKASQKQQKWDSGGRTERDMATAASGLGRAHHPSKREELLHLLSSTLTGKDASEQRRPTKRPSTGSEESRRKNKQIGQPRPFLVDALPVRSTLSPDRHSGLGYNLSDVSVPIADLTISGIATEEASASTSTLDRDMPEDQSTLHNYFRAKRRQLTFGSSNSEESSLSADLDLFIDGEEGLELEKYQGIKLKSSDSETVNYDGAEGPLKNLRNIWPRFKPVNKDKSDEEIPFAVIWEVCRVAQFCQVDPSKCRIQLQAGTDWKDQALLRANLKKNPMLVGKSFPPVNDDKAWRLALGDGLEGDKAVAYVVDFAYSDEPGQPLYKLKLRPLTLETSHRLARRFGADRFLELNMPDVLAHPPPSATCRPDEARRQIVRWLTSQSHYFLGRNWVSDFLSRETKSSKVRKPNTDEKVTEQTFKWRVRLFATHGDDFFPPDKKGIPSIEAAISSRPRSAVTMQDFNYFTIGVNRPANQIQPALKLFTRKQLSYSPTTPTAVLEPHQIRQIEQPIGTHMDMADGAGLISCTLARRISEILGLSHVPCAFQARFGPCKGMWMVDLNSEQEDDIWIKTFPSQRKWDCPQEDEAHRTFEVKNWPKPLQPASLNFQFIVILYLNAADKNAMKQLLAHHMAEGLREDLTSLQEAMKHPADLRSWIRKCGRSSGHRASHGFVKYLGGAPKSTEDEIVTMLDSGFKLDQQRYMCTILDDLVKNKAESLKTKLRIPVPGSMYAFMLPDPTGVLQEGEVSLCSSQQLQAAGLDDNWVEGPILVGRAPAHLSSDIQKVQAVIRPSLRKFKDVILFSIHGKVSLADKLSGGDFDGDQALCIVDRKIVEQFESQQVPKSPDLGLKRDKTTFQDFISRETRLYASKRRASQIEAQKNPDAEASKTSGPPILELALRKFTEHAFEFNTRENLLGKLTRYKERVAYHFPHKVKEVMHISFYLSALVDAAKQGTLFSETDWEQLRRKHNLPHNLERPAYESKEKREQQNFPTRHVLDWLYSESHHRIYSFMLDFQLQLKTKSRPYQDSDLSRLVKLTIPDDQLGRSFKTWLNGEIRSIADRWALVSRSGDYNATAQILSDEWTAIRPPPEYESLFRTTFVTGPNRRHDDDFSMVKAAFTFERWGSMKPRFVWRVANRQLCRLKALSNGVEDSATVTIVPNMYGILKPDGKLIERRALARKAGEEGALDSESEDDGF